MLLLLTLILICELQLTHAQEPNQTGQGHNDSIDYMKYVGKYGVIAIGIFVYFVIRVLEKIRQNDTKAGPPPKDDSQFTSDSRREDSVSTTLDKETETSNQSARAQVPRREGAEVLFACHLCNQSLAADIDSAGQQFACPNCGEQLVVPKV